MNFNFFKNSIKLIGQKLVMNNTFKYFSLLILLHAFSWFQHPLYESCPLQAQPKFDEVWLNQRHSVLGQTYKNIFSPNLNGTITCRPAVGLNSLKSVKFPSPAPSVHSLSMMRYGLTNNTVF